MGIPLDEERTPGAPVLRRRRIGEQFAGGLLKFEQRDLIRDGAVQYKDNGKARQELVVHLLTYGGDTAAAIGDVENVPNRGEVVRMILKGGGFGQWIEAKNGFASTAGRGLQVGDRIYINTTHVIRYESMGAHRALGEFRDQADLEAYYQTPAFTGRRESLGFRGDLKMRPANPDEAAFVAECEAAYHQLAQATRIDLDMDDTRGATGGTPDWVEPAPVAPAQHVETQPAPAPAPAPVPAAAAPAAVPGPDFSDLI